MTEQEKQDKKQELVDMGICPNCEKAMIMISGCKMCPHCGWSACSN